MNAHFHRAQVLLEQSRYELAEKQIREGLSQSPNEAYGHSLLALCEIALKKPKDALTSAQTAIGIEPDWAFAHYVLSRVHSDADRYDLAELAIREAIRLDPDDADYRYQLAAIYIHRSKWQDAVRAADEGLAIEPDHDGCENLRALALVKLGRRDEAGAGLDRALQRDPENALSHANMGWKHLHANRPKDALASFGEALRIDPTLEYARAGIIESLRARNLIYRGMLAYFLWMSRFSGRAQFGIIVGAWLLMRLLRTLAKSNPKLEPFVFPIIILYGVFVFLSWAAKPLFDLMLRASKFGRLALSEEQIQASNIVAGLLLLALSLFGIGFYFASGGLMLTAFGTLLLVIPVSSVFDTPPGRRRTKLLVYTGIMIAIGVSAIASTVVYPAWTVPAAAGYLLLFMGYGWYANAVNLRS
ncbi:MAG: tetratricopeptide repeat protein [Phycisphaerae bacterium]